MQLAIPLSHNGEPLFRQIYLGLRRAILSGTFQSNERLPSTRDLADQLGVSRTVVLLAYDQLLAEGFVAGRSGSGTYVAEGLSSNRLVTSKKSMRIRLSNFGSAAAKAALTWIFRGDDRPPTATISSLDGVRVTLKPFHSRCRGASCCGVHEGPRWPNLTTARRPGVSLCAKRYARICGGRAQLPATRRTSSWSAVPSKPWI